MADARPGCANLDLFSRECKAACVANKTSVPSLAETGKVASAGALEGPEVQVDATVCSAAGDTQAQEACDTFAPRTEQDDARDLNI